MSETLRVAYVVVSTGWDRHAQMAWLSATSLRIQEPRAQINVIVEASSPEVTEALAARFASLADHFIVKSSDVAAPVEKSRVHRIRLREYIAGDVVYIDSDTLAVGPVRGILNAAGDVAAAMDFNHPADSTWCPPDIEEPFRHLNWHYPLTRYVNAGVILLRDTPPVHTFCEEWLRRFGASTFLPHLWDQITFNSAVHATGVPFSVLPNGYNAMVVKRNYQFKDAYLLHFFGSPAEQRGTLMEHLLAHLQRTNEFDREAYDRSLRHRHPWGPNPQAWQLIHSRNYGRAVVAKLKHLIS